MNVCLIVLSSMFTLVCAQDTAKSFLMKDFQPSAVRSAENSNSFCYLICIDGGGTKTSMQILDADRNCVMFEKHGEQMDDYFAGPSNINAVGLHGVKKVLDDLFDGVSIDGESLAAIASQCRIIGGFAGLIKPEEQQEIKQYIKSYGYMQSTINHDAAILFDCFEGDGIVLIAGTGSICWTRKGDTLLRVGGLGYLLGDEGSGYAIGMQAIRAALEDLYGYGSYTNLSKALCEEMQVDSIEQIKKKLYAKELMPKHVARIAQIVFRMETTDKIARSIIEKATDDLAHMVTTAIKKLDMQPAALYCVGGLFKHEPFLQKVIDKAGVSSWKVNSLTAGNPIVRLIQTKKID